MLKVSSSERRELDYRRLLRVRNGPSRGEHRVTTVTDIRRDVASERTTRALCRQLRVSREGGSGAERRQKRPVDDESGE